MKANRTLRELGRWRFDEGVGDRAADSSGNGHILTGVGDFGWTSGPFGGAVVLDGATQWLSTAGPVLRTDQSFSVAAWVRLESSTMGQQVRLAPGVHALTAVSQSGPTHSPFYLGVRLIRETHVRWCFTVSPEDGVSVEWQHAASSTPIDESMFDRWTLIVGVLDVSSRTTHLYVRDNGDDATVHLPDVWTPWQADDGLQVGQGRFSAVPADMWPGSIGQMRVFSGALTAEDVENLHSNRDATS